MNFYEWMNQADVWVDKHDIAIVLSIMGIIVICSMAFIIFLVRNK